MPNELRETWNTVKMQADRIAQLEENLLQEHTALQAERARTFAAVAAPSGSHPALYEVIDCIQHKVQNYRRLL